MKFPIITFHSVDASGSVISISPERLAGIVRELAGHGWRGCTVSEALASWRRGDRSPRRVALTFDDGYRNLLSEALPTLSAVGFSATVFVVAGRCGQDNRWAGQPTSIPTLDLADWNELGTLRAAGWEIGAHGVEHVALTTLSEESAEHELRAARTMLEERLGSAVPLLAYPYGAHDARIRELARGIYDAACGTRLSLVASADLEDPFELPRLDAYYLRGFSPVKAIESPIGRGYLAVRRWARHLKHRQVGGDIPAPGR